MEQERFLAKFNPVVPRSWLFILAGVMWTGVGLMLCNYAYTWLANPPSLVHLGLGILGLAIAVLAYRFEFSKMALKNISRIFSLADKACVFSFISWKSYLIILVMVTLGILLKRSALPKPDLAIVYAAIGGALILASFHYYARFFQVTTAK